MSVDRTSLPVIGPDAPFRLPEFQRTVLVDGTRLWTVRHSRAPVLTVRLLFPSGAAVDPPGQAGLAALTADLLDEGSAEHSAMELHEDLSRIGGRLNTEVTSDATVLSLTTLARHAHRGLALLSEVATTPRFEVEDVERVRDLRLNRLRQLRQTPAALADRVFLESLYGSHPYGHLTIGTDTTLSALGRADVVACHERWYARSPWTLIAVGDVPADELRDAADDVFGGRGSLDEGGAATRSIPDPPPVGDRMIFVARQDAVQSEIRVGHAGVARRSPDYHALRVLNMVLGGQFVSRIKPEPAGEEGVHLRCSNLVRLACGSRPIFAPGERPDAGDDRRDRRGDPGDHRHSRPAACHRDGGGRGTGRADARVPS